MNLGLNFAIARPSGGGIDAAIRALFAANEQGAWYDASDFSTMYQDSAGTTPVTAIGQPVGLMLDKSRGLVRGAERLSNGDFSQGGKNWEVGGADATHIVTFSEGTVRYQSDTTTPALGVSQQLVLEIGKVYEVVTVVSAGSGAIKSDQFGGAIIANKIGVNRVIAAAVATHFAFTRSVANVDLTIDSISIKELPGAHASQPTAASRPILQQDENGKYFLSFDGVDDFLVTPSIDFTSTAQMTVIAGVRKNSDAAVGMLLELGVAAGNGVFDIQAPSTIGPTYHARFKGTLLGASASASGFAAGANHVISARGDIGGGTRSISVNGVSQASGAMDAGTGNFSSNALYIGRRAGTSLPFNGRLYSLIVRGAASNDSQIVAAERYVAGKTGVTL